MRKYGTVKRSTMSCEIFGFTDAATAPAGWRRESSPARFGPVIKPICERSVPSSCTTTSVIRDIVSDSIPLSVEIIGKFLGNIGAQVFKFALSVWAGIARTIDSPNSNAALISVVALRFVGKVIPGRNFVFVLRSVISATTASFLPQTNTSWPASHKT